IAEGKIAPPPETDAPSLDMAAINGAFLDCELGGLRQTATDITASLADLKGIETAVTERVGASQAPDLAPLSGLLTEGAALLHSRLAERAGEEAETAEVGVEATSPEAGAGPSTTAPQRITGEITSREDVVRTLDKLCDYYSRNEPSSPVPLLLQRARRLAKKDFMDIMRDLAPDALAQIEAIRGPNGDQ
ncbi:MAG: type VI secretion system protein TssA, partial [Pseudomonadota bacterium]|nr:type VI secretion system protein TssA [Pseudomonadota bacterium]